MEGQGRQGLAQKLQPTPGQHQDEAGYEPAEIILQRHLAAGPGPIGQANRRRLHRHVEQHHHQTHPEGEIPITAPADAGIEPLNHRDRRQDHPRPGKADRQRYPEDQRLQGVAIGIFTKDQPSLHPHPFHAEANHHHQQEPEHQARLPSPVLQQGYPGATPFAFRFISRQIFQQQPNRQPDQQRSGQDAHQLLEHSQQMPHPPGEEEEVEKDDFCVVHNDFFATETQRTQSFSCYLSVVSSL